MNRMLLAVAVLIVLPSLTAAQEQTTPEGLSESDVQFLKEAVVGLREAFAEEEQATTSQSAQTQNATTQTLPPKKSMADVADKVVDLGARAIAQAAGTVEKVAPEVWRIMIRQQYAKAAGLLIVPMGLFFACVFGWFKTRPIRTRFRSDESSKSEEDVGWSIAVGYAAPLAGMFIFGIWFLNRLADSVLFLFNPEYYAFRDLFVLILNQGQGL